MHESCCSDQGILNGVRVWYLKLCTTHRDRCIDRQDASGEGRKDAILQPETKRYSLGGVSSLQAKNANLQLMDGNDRDIQIVRLNTAGPSSHLEIRPTQTYLA